MSVIDQAGAVVGTIARNLIGSWTVCWTASGEVQEIMDCNSAREAAEIVRSWGYKVEYT